jgi:glycosyltransferase involved in cell wall biosynthesis
VHFGVDPNQFYPKTVFNLRQKYLRRKVIFCPRTIAPIYNTDILIEAFLKIQNTIPSHLILLGKNADEKYLIQIEKRLIQANLLDKVTILPGLSPSQMNNYFNLADVIVSLASSDGCPNSFLESLAVGAKIVVTNLPFTHEWPGTKFWRVPVRNVLVTVKTLKVVLKYPQNRWQKPSKKNRELVLKNANAFSHAQKLYNLYESLR